MKISKLSWAFVLIFLIGLLVIVLTPHKKFNDQWSLKSIDTMKYSRDQARATLNGKSFSYSIESQVADIANTGATHVAIGTPYDAEFLPVLKLWVKEARKNKLKVFFRGNFSGWEGWFGYEKIDHMTHLEKTKEFIHDNPDLFADGDIFSSCPECENGPKINLDDKNQLKNYRNFLLAQYRVTEEGFKDINKKAIPNYFSMNMDVAYKVMDPETTAKLGGVVVIDHYVKSPKALAADIKGLAAVSRGKIVLGEFGAPIPDIHGELTGQEQKNWIEAALYEIAGEQALTGVNYWVNAGGSTALWGGDGEPGQATPVFKKYYESKE